MNGYPPPFTAQVGNARDWIVGPAPPVYGSSGDDAVLLSAVVGRLKRILLPEIEKFPSHSGPSTQAKLGALIAPQEKEISKTRSEAKTVSLLPREGDSQCCRGEYGPLESILYTILWLFRHCCSKGINYSKAEG